MQLHSAWRAWIEILVSIVITSIRRCRTCLLYTSHISDDKTREQLLMDHLIGTAELAGQFAKAFDCEEQGRATAKSHDLGKATIAFEHRLLHDGPKVDHSTAGAKELYNIGGLSNILAAYCVACLLYTSNGESF